MHKKKPPKGECFEILDKKIKVFKTAKIYELS